VCVFVCVCVCVCVGCSPSAEGSHALLYDFYHSLHVPHLLMAAMLSSMISITVYMSRICLFICGLLFSSVARPTIGTSFFKVQTGSTSTPPIASLAMATLLLRVWHLPEPRPTTETILDTCPALSGRSSHSQQPTWFSTGPFRWVWQWEWLEGLVLSL